MAKLVNCKACGHQVAKTAKTCPSCGVKSPSGENPLLGCLGIILLIFAISIYMGLTGGKEETVTSSDGQQTSSQINNKKPDNTIQRDNAVPYSFLSMEDFSFSGRKRIQVNITAPTALNFEQFADTAIRAAKDYQQAQKAKVIYIFLGIDQASISAGDAYAVAKYAVDSRGNSGDQHWQWDVSAATNRLPEQQENILKLWENNKNTFRVDGLVDEDKLKAFIANQIGTQANEINFPWIERKTYLSK